MDIRSLVEEIYDQISLPAPREIIEFSSVKDAFIDFQEWSTRVGGVLTCFWSYQFPMAMPSSYWGAFHLKKDNYRLDVVRTPNIHGCFVYGKHINKAPVDRLSEAVYLKVCEELKSVKFTSASESIVDEILENRESEIGIFDSMMISEDPTCQMGVDDFIFLGDFVWLQQELWMLNKFKNDHGIPINQRMHDTLQLVVNSNKLLFTFKNMVVSASVT